MGDLYALDFDGVLCDSCGESSLSAVKVGIRNSQVKVDLLVLHYNSDLLISSIWWFSG